MATKDSKLGKYIFRPFYKKYVERKYNPELLDEKKILDNFKGPAIVLVNHCHILDPVFITTKSKLHIRWVTGSHLFKSRIRRFFIGKVADCISKQQGRSDLQTIKDISKALKNNEIVGMFPEGTRTWDGTYANLNTKTTAKLLKIFKAPVLFIRLEGAYDLCPRWADENRTGPLKIRVLKLIEKDDFKSLKLENIEKIITDNLGFSSSKWQEDNKVKYICDNKANGVERLLYTCPICESKSTIIGNKNEVKCNSCNTSDFLNEYMQFQNKSFKFENLSQWNDWQRNHILKEVLNNKLDFPSDKGVFFRIGKKNKFKVISRNFTIKLKNNSLIVNFEDREDIVFYLDKIQSFIINVKQTIELYYDDILYSIRMESYSNALKYYEAWSSINKG